MQVQVYLPVAVTIDVANGIASEVLVGEWEGAPWLDMGNRPNIWAPPEARPDDHNMDWEDKDDYGWMRNNEWETLAERALRAMVQI